MRTLLLFFIIGVAYVASMPIENEETEDADISVVNDTDDADKRKEVPKQEAKKVEGTSTSIFLLSLMSALGCQSHCQMLIRN